MTTLTEKELGILWKLTENHLSFTRAFGGKNTAEQKLNLELANKIWKAYYDKKKYLNNSI